MGLRYIYRQKYNADILKILRIDLIFSIEVIILSSFSLLNIPSGLFQGNRYSQGGNVSVVNAGHLLM
jgi:hypothetical protein